MILLVIAVIVFFVVRGLIMAMGNLIIPKDELKEEAKDTFIIHNHITENHLHISKEDLKSLIDK